MTRNRLTVPWFLRALSTALPVLLAGCAGLLPEPEPPPAFYSLDVFAPVLRPAAALAASRGATLVVNAPSAAPGFDSQRIIFVRKPHELEYFAHSQWVDTPARMLAPLIVAAIEKTGAFHAVAHAPSSALGDMRLDTEIIRLQQVFLQSPSRVHFTLRATLVDSATRRVLATREFDGYATALSENPYGGVLAANKVVASVLDELAAFCAGFKR